MVITEQKTSVFKAVIVQGFVYQLHRWGKRPYHRNSLWCLAWFDIPVGCRVFLGIYIFDFVFLYIGFQLSFASVSLYVPGSSFYCVSWLYTLVKVNLCYLAFVKYVWKPSAKNIILFWKYRWFNKLLFALTLNEILGVFPYWSDKRYGDVQFDYPPSVQLLLIS